MKEEWGGKWRIIEVYVKVNLEEVLKEMEEWIEKKEAGSRILGGDFNVRTGREGGAVREEDERESGSEKGRRSKDEKINRDGRRLVELVEEKG